MTTRLLIGSCLLLAACAPGCAQISQAVSSVLPDKTQQTKTQFSVARLQERQGNLVQARQKYEEIAARDPRHVDSRHRLAVVHSRLGDLDQADRYFQEALDLAPNNAEVWCDLGYALHMHNDAAAAEEALNHALQCDPGNKRAINNLALVLGQQNRFDESLAMFRRSGTEAEAQANLAYLYAQAGRGQKAIDHYSLALDHDADLNAAKAALVQLAALKAKAEPQTPLDPRLVAQTAEVLKQLGPLPESINRGQRPTTTGIQQASAEEVVGEASSTGGRDSHVVPASAVAPAEDPSAAPDSWTMPRPVQAVGWANGNRDGSTAATQVAPQGEREPGAWRDEEATFAPHVEAREVTPREWIPDDMHPVRE